MPELRFDIYHEDDLLITGLTEGEVEEVLRFFHVDDVRLAVSPDSMEEVFSWPRIDKPLPVDIELCRADWMVPCVLGAFLFTMVIALLIIWH